MNPGFDLVKILLKTLDLGFDKKKCGVGNRYIETQLPLCL